MLVRNGERESLAQLHAHESIESIDVRTPSLEEIFVAYMRNEGGSSQSKEFDQVSSPTQ
ncbi:MAG: hypothetical protein QGG09_02135 [Pirellulaceae bacterium]|nr:hypothetical protein [Pirellulaceae bacterium]HJN10526.1 hypothetical protein [Pirellulaceae bacterium]